MAPEWALEEGLPALLDWIGEQPESPAEPSDHAYVTALAEVGDLAPGRQR